MYKGKSVSLRKSQRLLSFSTLSPKGFANPLKTPGTMGFHVVAAYAAIFFFFREKPLQPCCGGYYNFCSRMPKETEHNKTALSKSKINSIEFRCGGSDRARLRFSLPRASLPCTDFYKVEFFFAVAPPVCALAAF